MKHDGGPTFGFRFEGTPDLFGKAPALAYTADLGTWDAELADALTDVDLLAVEFNHDEELERRSGRSPHLIARVLGDAGHLSNCQAASLVGRTDPDARRAVAASRPVTPQPGVQPAGTRPRRRRGRPRRP